MKNITVTLVTILTLSTSLNVYAIDSEEAMLKHMNGLGFGARVMTMCNQTKLSVKMTMMAAIYMGTKKIKDTDKYLASFDKGVDDAKKLTFTAKQCDTAVKLTMLCFND